MTTSRALTDQQLLALPTYSTHHLVSAYRAGSPTLACRYCGRTDVTTVEVCVASPGQRAGRVQ